MRLINIEDEPLLKTVSAGGLSAKALWKLIKSQKTVKAIPIEWIKKWLNETEDDRIVCFDIRDMLADWEKENE